MEKLQKIILFIVTLFILLIVIYLISKPGPSQLTKINNADKNIILPPNNKNNSSNYTYSIWLYVNDWNYKYGQKKVVFERIDTLGNPMPSMELDSFENNLIINISCYNSGSASDSSGSSTGASPVTASGGTITPVTNNKKIQKCKIRNIPIQRWTNVIISTYGRTLDVYLDGKLVRTCILDGVPDTNPKLDTSVTPNGGFSGYTSSLTFKNTSSNPSQAYSIYKKGNGVTPINSFFNKYKLRFSLLSNNNVTGSMEI